MLVAELVAALAVELHDSMLRFDGGDLVMGIDPEVDDDDLDVVERRPARVDQAGGIFEAVGRRVVRRLRVGSGEPCHLVRDRLAVGEPGAVPPSAIDRDVAEPPAGLQLRKVRDPLATRAAPALPACDEPPSADHGPALVAGRGGKNGRALGGARVLDAEDQRLAQLVMARVDQDDDRPPGSSGRTEAADGIPGSRHRGERAILAGVVRRGEGAGPVVASLRSNVERRRGLGVIVGAADASEELGAGRLG